MKQWVPIPFAEGSPGAAVPVKRLHPAASICWAVLPWELGVQGGGRVTAGAENSAVEFRAISVEPSGAASLPGCGGRGDGVRRPQTSQPECEQLEGEGLLPGTASGSVGPVSPGPGEHSRGHRDSPGCRARSWGHKAVCCVSCICHSVLGGCEWPGCRSPRTGAAQQLLHSPSADPAHSIWLVFGRDSISRKKKNTLS